MLVRGRGLHNLVEIYSRGRLPIWVKYSFYSSRFLSLFLLPLVSLIRLQATVRNGFLTYDGSKEVVWLKNVPFAIWVAKIKFNSQKVTQ